jgi:hypothetical protein
MPGHIICIQFVYLIRHVITHSFLNSLS